MEDRKITMYAVEVPSGFYVNLRDGSWQTQYLFFDGKPAEKTWVPDWWKIDQIPERIYRPQKRPNVNYRYRLIDESLTSEKIPVELPREEAMYQDEDGYWKWKEEYGHLSSLYKELSDPQPDEEVDQEFETVILISVPEITPPEQFSYPYAHTNWGSGGKGEVTGKDIIHQLLDRLLFAPVMIHQTPCKLTSKASYDIVRQYVKNNINPQAAKITSDYDFCFDVKKRVPRSKEYKYSVDVNLVHNMFGGRKRRPKYETRTSAETEWRCFQMTYSPENYKGYTPIEGFEGKDEAELKANIDAYLQELIAVINEPLMECPTCEGVGVLRKENLTKQG